MTKDWSQAITREYTGGDIRFDFPVRPLGWSRLFGLLPLGIGVAFVWMPGQMAWEFTQKLLHGDRDLSTIIFSVFPLLFLIVGCVPLGIGLAILFGRCRVQWQAGQLSSTELAGLLRWTRRLPPKPIRKLEVGAAMARTGNSPPTRMEKFSGLAILYEDGSRKLLVVGYPMDWLLAVAQELRTYVDTGSFEPPRVEVIETLGEPEHDDEATLQQPPDCGIRLEESATGARIVVPPAGPQKSSKGLFFFALLWCGFMCVFSGITLFNQFKGDEKVAVTFWLFISSFWLIGLGMLAGAINMGRRRAEITADSSRLQIEVTGLFGVKQGRWTRPDIAAIRADASGMEVNDRPVIELQVYPAAGKKAGFLAGRDEAELRWMAAYLRWVMKVPAHDPGAPR